MSQIKKHTWKGLAVVAAMLLSVGLITQSAFAAVTVTQRASASISATNTNVATGTGAYTTLPALVLTENIAGDIGLGTLTLTTPAGWEWNTAATPTITTVGGAGFAATPANTSATVKTITVTAASTAPTQVSIGNLQIRPLTASSSTGNIVSGGTATVAGFPAGSNAGTITSLVDVPVGAVTLTMTASACSVAVDGTTTSTISISPKDASGNAVSNLLITVSTNRGTLSVTSNTTSSTTITSGATGTGTVTFRGNGTTGDANITATTAAPNAAIATDVSNCLPDLAGVIKVISTTSTPTEIKLIDITNSGHIAANLSTVYSSPTTNSRVRFQVRGSQGFGVNNQLIQATVDKGYIQQGDVASCPSANTTASSTSATVTIDDVQVDGVVVFTVCARAGQTGAVKVTAKNLSTTMADASATLTSAGVPNKIETTVTGGAVTATIRDKDGNEVADGTTVTFGVPSFTGTVAPTCGLTTNGKVSAAAAFSGTGGQVLITVFINDSGDVGSASTCSNLGSVAAVSSTVQLGSGVVTPPPAQGACAGFVGQAPARGSIALLVTNGTCTAPNLVAAFATAGCTVESLAILEGGVWKIYINGAPAVVNAAFPASLAPTTAFFVRCQA